MRLSVSRILIPALLVFSLLFVDMFVNNDMPISSIRGDVLVDGDDDIVYWNTTEFSTESYTAPFFEVYKLKQYYQCAWGLTAADFNNDGLLDFAVGRSDGPCWMANLSIFYGNGNRSFKVENITLPLPYGPVEDLDAADFNGDGYMDILVSRGIGCGFNDSIDILWNEEGCFDFDNRTHIANFTLYGIPEFNVTGERLDWIIPKVAVADFDMDGDIDFIVSTNCAEVKLFKNNGDCSFSSEGIIYDYGYLGRGLAVGDFNKDGYPDFVISASTDNTSNFTDPGHIYIKLNDRTEGCFNSSSPGILVSSMPVPFDYTIGAFEFGSIEVFDYNGDGLLDIVFGGDEKIYMFIQQENLTFKPFLACMLRDKKLTWVDRLYNGGFTSGDFNYDGLDDLVVGGVMGTVRLLINNRTLVCVREPEDRWVYLFGEKVFHLAFPGQKIVIGSINVTADSLELLSKVNFYLNGRKVYSDTQEPFMWQWCLPGVGRCVLSVEAYDSRGVFAGRDSMVIWKFI